MTSAALVSFGVIFLAELGDKSQLMALTFALRHRWWVVLSAITAAAAVTQLLAVAAGHYLAVFIPAELVAVISGLAFVAVGFWALREERPDSTPPRAVRSAFLTVSSAFVLAELGDRTMFATLTLAGRYDWVGVWLGSALAMAAAGALAIAAGLVAGQRIPLTALRLASAFLFLWLGAWTLLGVAVPPLPEAGAAVLAAATVAAIAVWRGYTGRARRPASQEFDDGEMTGSAPAALRSSTPR
jgi:putative Ca2+/H+ antiporter (TMEM165/GDT1 family)